MLRLLETTDIILWELFLSFFVCGKSEDDLEKSFTIH